MSYLDLREWRPIEAKKLRLYRHVFSPRTREEKDAYESALGVHSLDDIECKGLLPFYESSQNGLRLGKEGDVVLSFVAERQGRDFFARFRYARRVIGFTDGRKMPEDMPLQANDERKLAKLFEQFPGNPTIWYKLAEIGPPPMLYKDRLISWPVRGPRPPVIRIYKPNEFGLL